MEREKLTVLLNEEDIRRMTEIAYSKDVNKRLKKTVNITKWMFMSVIAAAVIAGAVLNLNNPQQLYLFIGFGIFWAVILLIAVLLSKKKLKKNKEKYITNELARRKNGFFPRTYTFEKDGIHTCGRYSDFVVDYDELHECHEYADGLFFRYESGQILWLPARFFTKSLAEEACGAMKYVFMKNYFLHEKLSAPETPEAAAEEQLIEPHGEADYIIEYKTSKFSLLQRVVNAAIGKKFIIILISLYLIVSIGANAVKLIISLMSRTGMPFDAGMATDIIGIIFELCLVFFFIISIIVMFMMPHKIYKANSKWVSEGTRLELYENGFIEKIAAGCTFTPWENVRTVLYSAGDLMIMDKSGRGIIIPESALKEKREEIENAIRAHLPQEHEHHHEHDHGEHCNCGCEHEHDHEHDEHCTCEECEGKK